jgi:hypothetical protein
VTKIVSDLRLAYSTNKSDRHDIAKLLLKVTLNYITLTQETVNQRTDNTMTKGRKKQIDKEESTKHYTELLVSRKSEYKQIIMPTF